MTKSQAKMDAMLTPSSIAEEASSAAGEMVDPVFRVLLHSQQLLIIQTNAGVDLEGDLAGTQLATNSQMAERSTRQSTQQLATQSASAYGRFNLGLHVADDPKAVLRNRGQLLQLLNGYLANQPTPAAVIHSIYWLNQTHSNQVVTLTEPQTTSLQTLAQHEAQAVFRQTQSLAQTQSSPASPNPVSVNIAPTLIAPDADALVTQLTGTALAIMTADCVPIVVYGSGLNDSAVKGNSLKDSGLKDNPPQQIAAIHAGWKGLANGIIASTCATFKRPNAAQPHIQSTHANAPRLQAWIGASIGVACYEVSQTVVDDVLQGCERLGLDRVALRRQIVSAHDDADKAWLNLPLLAQLQLQALGVEVDNPAYACSYSDSRYYSYRRMTHRQQKNTGRMALLIVQLS